MGSEGHHDEFGKKAVGSWISVIPCTLDGSPCNDCFASPEKENVRDQAQAQPSPGSHDYGLRKIDGAQAYSRKVLDVSHAETSNHAGNRDALHVPTSGQTLKGAFMEDMRDMRDSTKKPTSRRASGRPNVDQDLVRNEHAEPSLGQSRASKASEDRPNVVGPKKKKSSKNSKKATTVITSPTEKGKGGPRREKSRAGGRTGSEQLSGVGILFRGWNQCLNVVGVGLVQVVADQLLAMSDWLSVFVFAVSLLRKEDGEEQRKAAAAKPQPKPLLSANPQPLRQSIPVPRRLALHADSLEQVVLI
ncbi:hypothetical protein Ancab_028679 [Ancistrocladus abbreviatus]